MSENKFYINDLSEIRAFCTKSDKEDVYKYIYSLQQENNKRQERMAKALDITYKIMMNNADNRMIANDEEKEYFDWLDSKLLKQEELLKGVNYEQKNDI